MGTELFLTKEKVRHATLMMLLNRRNRLGWAIR